MRYRVMLLAAAAVAWAAGAALAAQPIGVVINDQPQYYDVPPMMVNGRVMVPMRGIFEALGAQVSWDGAQRTVTAARGESQMRLTVGNQWAMVNGKTTMLDTPPRMEQSRVLVPLRFVSESLGAEVKWDGPGRQVLIQQAGMVAMPAAPVIQGKPPAPVPVPVKRALPETRVAVGLQEYTITLTPNRVKAGKITFDVLNKGIATHAIAIEGTDARTENLGRGHKATLTVTLKPGVYTVYCPVGNHRQTGMVTTLVVE
jgi:hypothetical protein